MSAIRIASYNLFNGAADTYFRLVDFAKAQKFDVLCLQEINGWQDNNFARLKDFADQAGHTAYEYGNSNSEYKLVTLTSLPVRARTVHVEGFWHCAVELHVTFGGAELVIVNLHLDPWKEDPRLREIERLLELIDVSKPTIIIGDLNSLSRADNYSPEFLAKLKERKFDKFGANTLDYRVTDFLTNAGFVDAATIKRAGAAQSFTTPTPYRNPNIQESTPASEAPARIDYAFVSSSLAPMIQNFEVIETAETDKISDHYPIVLTLGDQPPATSPQPAPGPDTAGDLHIDHVTPEPAEAPTPQPAAQPEIPSDQTDNLPDEGEIRLH